jgi:hypothetical protein
MHADPVATVQDALTRSELIRAVATVREDGGRRLALPDTEVRSLRPEEIAQLEALGNWSDDWSRVRVPPHFDGRRVRHSRFHGEVVLGKFTRSVRLPEGIELPSGVYRSTLRGCVIGNDALVQDVGLLVNYVVGEGALLLHCGDVICDGWTAFANGIDLPLGIECGGREVRVFAEIDLATASLLTRSRSQKELLASYETAVAAYRARAVCERGIIQARAVVRNTPAVRNAYLGPWSRTDGAALLANATVLSDREQPTEVASGACVNSALLQWGSRVAAGAVVERSVLAESSTAERHARITGSIVGSNTTVAGGEVTSCLLGPFVGFHHQALLIAALWPEGRGNVAAGANAGSNHTGRAPDQEFWPGEGMFIGLGANIRYPADFSGAPYTTIACGVTTLPQRVTFPFSLVRQPSRHEADFPPGHNEIVPGWSLSENLYALRRTQRKQQARNRARRAQFCLDILRPEMILLLRDAHRRLQALPHVKEVYTERDIEGLGKNVLLEANRESALYAYHLHVACFALLGLKRAVEVALLGGRGDALSGLLLTPSEEPTWELQRRILCDERRVRDVRKGLLALPGCLETIASHVERSRAKDDDRGRRIIPDYAEAHDSVREDCLVQEAWDEARRARCEVNELLATLDRRPSSPRDGECPIMRDGTYLYPPDDSCNGLPARTSV